MRRERGGILGALLLTGLVIVCLAIVAAIVVARNVHVTEVSHNGGDDVSVDTPFGNLSVRAHEKAGTAVKDIPFYPGAHNVKDNGGDAVIQWTSNNDKTNAGFSVSASEMVTSDSLDKVVDWYRAQLPNWIIAKRTGRSAEFELRNGGYKRIIGISEHSDGTHIGVATIGEPASN